MTNARMTRRVACHAEVLAKHLTSFTRWTRGPSLRSGRQTQLVMLRYPEASHVFRATDERSFAALRKTNPACHAEVPRSISRLSRDGREILRCAQDDKQAAFRTVNSWPPPVMLRYSEASHVGRAR